MLVQAGKYVFTTEGHPIPVNHPLMRQVTPQCMPVSGAVSEEQASESESFPALPAHDKVLAQEQLPAEGVQDIKGEPVSSFPGTKPDRIVSEGGSVKPDGTEREPEQQQKRNGNLAEAQTLPAGLECATEAAADRERSSISLWGILQSNASALDALVCPDLTQVWSPFNGLAHSQSTSALACLGKAPLSMAISQYNAISLQNYGRPAA